MGGDANRSDDTLSLKISCRNAARTIRGGRFLHSVPLRSTTVEMTEGAGRLFIICGVSRHHHPLNLLNPLNLHTEGVSNEPSRRRCGQRRSRKGGGERSEPMTRMLIMPYDTARSSRNADFMLIARKGDTTTLGPKGRQT